MTPVVEGSINRNLTGPIFFAGFAPLRETFLVPLNICFFIRSAGGGQVLARLWRVGRSMFNVRRSSFKTTYLTVSKNLGENLSIFLYPRAACRTFRILRSSVLMVSLSSFTITVNSLSIRSIVSIMLLILDI